MVTLTGTERSRLERVVVQAREVAERGVRKRFDALDLSGTAAPIGLSEEDRTLRNALRERARKLGRGRVDENLVNVLAIRAGEAFLVEELAYETWHRMLFARFLVENDLLIHPAFGVALSGADLDDLASENGSERWELAAAYASNRIPGLFHLSSPLRLTQEDRHDLTQLLEGLEPSLFHATDSLGWVYQYWQSTKKDEVNASGEKITGATLPAVTQLFTEDYMVDFLLQNSLGAWYVSRYPDTPLRDEWEYLRYRDDGMPAGGTFETWPETVAEVTVMDPCCGSGHFLVAAFHMLAAMRQEQEGLNPSDAADAVLRDNLYGLELDARCTQIATFSVALEAWKLGGHPEVNVPQVACSGIPVAGQKSEWLKLAKGNANLEIALSQLYKQFSQAGELGSLVNPKQAVKMATGGKRGQTGFALAHDWEDVRQLLHTALERERTTDPAGAVFAAEDDDLVGTLKAARLLSRTFTLIATNVPYLSRGGQGDALKRFADETYPDAKHDLATVFLERCLGLVQPIDDAKGTPIRAGTVAAVTPQNWLFLGRYRIMRRILLERDSLGVIARLGSGAFRAISGEVVNVALLTLTATGPSADATFIALDASQAPGPDSKAQALISGPTPLLHQALQRENPDQRIVLDELDGGALLSQYADCPRGIVAGDRDFWVRKFWELPSVHQSHWRYLQSTVEQSMPFGGREHVINWSTSGKGMLRPGVGNIAYGKHGVVISQMGALPFTAYTGELYDNNCAAVVPRDPTHLPALWAFCSSPEFAASVRKIDPKMNVTNATLVKVPFDLERWRKTAMERYPDGLPEPYSNDPSQWLFQGLIMTSDQPLQVAMARLLGFIWPDQAVDGLGHMADPDGIVCLPSVYGEPSAEQRLRDLLRAAYGDAWSPRVLADLLKGENASSLEEWLRSKIGFFAHHVKLFQNRPFLWQITDGRKDGFSAVVNYHKLTSQGLSKLIYTYLGDWITRQERAVERQEAGAAARLEAATSLRSKLIAVAAGEPPYDIYVRWKPLAEQPIGWDPDLNDGVRLNIRPFIEAGVLQAKVNVKWGKDRGKDPSMREEPLMQEAVSDLKKRLELHCSVDRHNDLHFSVNEKQRARELVGTPEGQLVR